MLVNIYNVVLDKKSFNRSTILRRSKRVIYKLTVESESRVTLSNKSEGSLR